MSLLAKIVERDEWEKIEHEAHTDLFGDKYLSHYKDYAFVVLVTKDSVPFCYSTVKELSRDCAYLAFGGTFSKFRGQKESYGGFHEIVDCLKKKYPRIGYTCRTKNVGMIKLGLNEGFEIVGTRLVYGLPNVEMLLDTGG